MEAKAIPNLRQRTDDLRAIQVDGLIDNSVTDFDLYLEVGGHMVLYAPSPYRWNREELARLLLDGYAKLFYGESDENKVKAYQKISNIKPIDETLPPKMRIRDISDAAAEFTRVLFDYPLTSATLSKGADIAEALVRCVGEDVSCVQALGLLAHHDHYTYYHSARVAAYSLAVAMKMSVMHESHLQEIALGCLLHDIGKSKVPLDIINKRGPLNEKEWEAMRKHPEHGVELIRSARLGAVPIEIILHHHERIDGQGYPHGLTRNELIEEVKIAAFADVFDALTTNRPYQQARTKYEALDFIRFHLLDNISREAFKAMVAILKEEQDEEK